MGRLDRGEFLRLAAVTAATAGTVGAAPAGAQTPAPAPAEDDIGFVSFGAAAERVCLDFYDRALRRGRWGAAEERRLRTLRAQDRAHYVRLLALLGEDAPAPGDFEADIPAAALRSNRRILNLGDELERLVAGVYLAGVAEARDAGTRLLLGRLLVQETQHVATLALLGGARGVTGGQPGPIALERASVELERYLRPTAAPPIPES